LQLCIHCLIQSSIRPYIGIDSVVVIGDDSLRVYIDSLWVDLPLMGEVLNRWMTEDDSYWLWEDGAFVRMEESAASDDTLQAQWVWRWVSDTDSTDVSSRDVGTYTLADGFGLEGTYVTS